MIFFLFLVDFYVGSVALDKYKVAKDFYNFLVLFNGQFFLCISYFIRNFCFFLFCVRVSVFIIITLRSIFPYNRKTYWTHRGERKRWSGHIFKQPQKKYKKKRREEKSLFLFHIYIFFFIITGRPNWIITDPSIHPSIYLSSVIFFFLF